MKAIGNSRIWTSGDDLQAADRRERNCRSPHSATPFPEAGFTLLEVMVALAIVAIALVTLLGLATRTITVNEKVQRVTRATLLAQQRLAELETSVAASGPEEVTNGLFLAPFEAFRWEISYADTPLAFVRQVTVTVAWGRVERNEAVALTSFLLRPGGVP